ncbi:hypothetical protein LTR10_021725 [Elasticomyces elasticus]|nr:hypothetical protein LTR10_021725 [Elasticomyces elasticus]KAK5037297.1 hypothetical protein LTR13_005103 [Exophiala sideris]KAK5182455.1 hypothetical protein LTR44_005467 [Eurotiomycetes sp. CCFEE 6388]
MGISQCVSSDHIALTFDDGPYNFTWHLLDVLASYNAKATFFVTGNNLGKGQIDVEETGYPALLRRMHADGHQIASHTWTHQNLTDMSEEHMINQMHYNEMAFRNVLGFFPTYMRPPYSECNSTCQAIMKKMGYHLTLYTLVTHDYLYDDPTLIQAAKDSFVDQMEQAKNLSINTVAINHDILYQTAYNLTNYMLDYMKFLNYDKLPGSAYARSLHDNSPDCDCYVTNGSSSAFFEYHRFYDFRNVGDGSIYDHEPANVTNSQSNGDEPGQQGYLNTSAFAKDWNIQNWGHEREGPDYPVTVQNSPQNVFIGHDPEGSSTSHLTLRAYRTEDFTSTAELENLQRNLLHASIRLHARVRGATGVVAGMFTYLNDSQESDIEILTRDPPNCIRYTNQPSVGSDGYDVPGASTEIELPAPIVWSDWVTHRLDWTSQVSSWYADSQWLLDKEYGIPYLPSYLVLNLWSNGGDWSGNMTLGSAAYLDIQWIDMVFNTSGSDDGYKLGGSDKVRRNIKSSEKRANHCHRVCAVDNISATGFPILISQAVSTMITPRWMYVHVVGLGLAMANMFC